MSEPHVQLVATSKLHQADWNPRSIDAARLANLVAAVREDPDFLWRRPILAMADGTVYAGNMRLRAATELGMAKVPAVIGDVDERTARERAIRDNEQWGEWRRSDLGALLSELREGGVDLTILGLTQTEITRAMADDPPLPTQFAMINPDTLLDDVTAVTCPGCAFQFAPEYGAKVRPPA